MVLVFFYRGQFYRACVLAVGEVEIDDDSLGGATQRRQK